MQVVETKVMKGPNFWSVSNPKVIVLTLSLNETTIDSCKLSNLKTLVKRNFPQTAAIESNYKTPDERLNIATHVTKLALELQQQAGLNTTYCQTLETEKHGTYRVIFSYEEAESGKHAAKSAVKIISAFLENEAYDFNKDIKEIQRLYEGQKCGPSTGSIVAEALRRNIPVIRLDGDSLVQLGYGARQKRIEATITSNTSNIAVDLAGDKERTKQILDAAELPVPKGSIVTNERELKDAIEVLGYPLVLKPVDGNHGNGASTDITNEQDAVKAFNEAKKFSERVICERLITGRDFRALVINYKFEAAAMRTPAAVIGDGKSTIQQLISEVNSDPRRGHGHDKVLTEIIVDDATNDILSKKNITLNTVLSDGQELWLKPTANLSTGGTATDVTDDVHPENIALFERVARIIGLDVCGIDIMASDLRTPITKTGGAIIEVNAAPGFRMHLEPTNGTPRNVAKPVLDMLFPKNCTGRIPIVAVTGTNGKTTTTRVIAHIGKTVGHTVGYTTTDGVYVQDSLIVKGDCAGPSSAEIILKDPSVDLAVLECARGGMLRSGLAFSACDVAVITNVAEDHLGLNGINTVEELAKVKCVLAKSVHKDGFAVLNADDDLVYAMREELECNVALFSLNDKSARIKNHVVNGGIAAVCERGFLTILHGNKKIRVDKVANIPITFGGKAEFNIANCLGASLAGYVRDVRIEDIRKALQTFIPGADVTPGRMNIFDFKDFTIMLDYAHNPHGMQAIGKFIKSVDANPKVGVIAGVGDRRDEDLIALGEEAAKIFDEIIIRLDRDLRGRTANELTLLVSKGVKQLDPLKKIRLFEEEREAIDFVLNNATPGSFVVVLSDTVTESLEQIKEAKSKKDANAPLTYVHSMTA